MAKQSNTEMQLCDIQCLRFLGNVSTPSNISLGQLIPKQTLYCAKHVRYVGESTVSNLTTAFYTFLEFS